MKKNIDSISLRLEELNQHKTIVIWLTGYSGAGKSTIANYAQYTLIKKGLRTTVLDGDILRQSLCRDLGFTQKDRSENLRRTAELAKIISDNGNIVICSFISPLHSQREQARSILGNKFYEVHIDTSIEECEKKDVKGLYKKARSGEIKEFTGISSKYESPKNPDLKITTSKKTIEDSSKELIDFIEQKI